MKKLIFTLHKLLLYYSTAIRDIMAHFSIQRKHLKPKQMPEITLEFCKDLSSNI